MSPVDTADLFVIMALPSLNLVCDVHSYAFELHALR